MTEPTTDQPRDLLGALADSIEAARQDRRKRKRAMEPPTTIVVPQGQEANALNGFVGLTEQPTREEYDPSSFHATDTIRVPLQSGDRVRFVTKEECGRCGGSGFYGSSVCDCSGGYVGLVPLLRDGQPVEGEVVEWVEDDRVDVWDSSMPGWYRPVWDDPRGDKRMMPREQYESLPARRAGVLLWKETS